ncbi:MAG: hypothetical protein ACI9UK_000858, partial [Candidatus Krumholzibacteriia bacterium]
ALTAGALEREDQRIQDAVEGGQPNGE